MERLTLTRLETGDQGTFGRLLARGQAFFTGELPWRENRTNVSCIPPGLYGAAWTWSPKFGRLMYLVHPVKGRQGIRIHFANLMGDVENGLRSHLNGCLALGDAIGKLDGQKALLLSKPAIRRFESLMEQQPFQLEIR